MKSDTTSTARLHHANDGDLDEILALIKSAFAYMDERIDPPSSMQRLSLSDIQEHCRTGEVWSMGDPIQACMVLNVKNDALYLGRLSIDQHQQGRGIGTLMIEHAINRAQAHSIAFLELKTRVELTENHAFFKARGFHTVSEHAHKGYNRPTYITMRRPVDLTSSTSCL